MIDILRIELLTITIVFQVSIPFSAALFMVSYTNYF